MLADPAYRRPLLEGLIPSVGGVDPQLAKAASAALLEVVGAAQQQQQHQQEVVGAATAAQQQQQQQQEGTGAKGLAPSLLSLAQVGSGLVGLRAQGRGLQV